MGVGFVAVLGRPADPASRFSLYAEDGPVYVTQSRSLGIWRSLHASYASYYQLAPRVAAAIGALFPLRHTPVILACLAALMVAACAAIVWRCGLALRLSRPAAAVLGFAMLLLPAAGYDVVGNITNVNWYLLGAAVVFLAAWMAGYRPRLLPSCGLLAIAGLSSPLLILCAPFVAVVALVRRSRLDLAVLGTLVVTSAVQLAPSAFGFDRPVSMLSRVHFRQLVDWYPFRVVGGALLGDRLLGRYYDTLGRAGFWTVGAIVILGLLVFTARAQGFRRGACLFLMVESVLLYFVPLALRGYDYFGSKVNVLAHGRYMGVPALCVFLVALMALESWASNSRWPAARALMYGLLVLSVVAMAMNYSVTMFRLPSRSWRRALREEQAACAANPAGHTVVVGIAPDPGSWRVTLTCDEAFP
jgi:hypothetical protein